MSLPELDAHAPQTPFGVVCDIDGVVYRSRILIEGSDRAIQRLQRHDIDFMFVTNDGGMEEQHKADVLSKMCGLEISEESVLLSHTPIRDIDNDIKARRVLLLGSVRGRGLKTLENYGFTNVVWFDDFLDRHPYMLSYFASRNVNPDPAKADEIVPKDEMLEEEPFGAVVVIHEPMNWYEGLQLCLDVIVGNGRPGILAEDHSIPVYISNPDLEYSGTFHTPRLTAGAYATCLNALYKEKTGRELATLHQSGKPLQFTYDYVLRRMQLEPDRLYFIGDNPLSDICGANRMGFFSILVRTGCFQGGENDETYPAKKVCQDLEEAVDFILKREGVTI